MLHNRTYLKTTRSLKHPFWHYLKRFRTLENVLKTRYIKKVFWSYLKQSQLFESNVTKAYLSILFLKDIRNCNKKNNTYFVLKQGGTWGRGSLLEKKERKWCILTIFETISNYREKIKTLTVNGAFWPYLKRFGTAENILKTGTVNGSFWRCLKRFGTAENILKTGMVNGSFWRHLKRFRTARKNWNTDGKYCILTIFEIIWNYREQFENRDSKCFISKWRYLKRFRAAEITLKQGRFRVHYDIFLKRYLKPQWENQHMFWLYQEVVKRSPATWNIWKQGQWSVHSDAFWKDSHSELLRTRTVNDAISCYLIRCNDLQRKNWKQ